MILIIDDGNQRFWINDVTGFTVDEVYIKITFEDNLSLYDWEIRKIGEYFGHYGFEYKYKDVDFGTYLDIKVGIELLTELVFSVC